MPVRIRGTQFSAGSMAPIRSKVAHDASSTRRRLILTPSLPDTTLARRPSHCPHYCGQCGSSMSMIQLPLAVAFVVAIANKGYSEKCAQHGVSSARRIWGSSSESGINLQSSQPSTARASTLNTRTHHILWDTASHRKHTPSLRLD